MTDKQKNVPYRRFKEFKNADAWEQRKVKDCATFAKGKGYSKNDLRKKGIPIILYGSLYTNYQTSIFRVNTFVKEKSNSVYSNGNEVIVPGSGETAEDIARASVIKKPGIIIGGDLNIIYSSSKIDPEFLAILLSNGAPQKELARKAQGKSIVHIHNLDIEKVKILFPKIEEQRKICHLLQRIDHLITLHQRKYDKLKKLKSAYLTEMFPAEGERKPKRRFSGFTDDWEQRKLGDIVSFFSGLTYTPADVVSKPGTLVLRSSNVKDNTIINADDVYVKSEAVNSANVQNGDVIVVVRNGSRNLIGKHAEVKKEMANTVIGAFMTGVRYDTPNFVNALFDTNQFKIEISKNLGATINQITTGNFKNMLFKFPTDNNEQNKIGEFFSQLDHLITLHQQQLEKLKNLKQAYLNEMFV